MKFKVGDKVKVRDDSRTSFVGKKGKVIYVDRRWAWPYTVDFGENGGYDFHANELEKVED